MSQNFRAFNDQGMAVAAGFVERLRDGLEDDSILDGSVLNDDQLSFEVGGSIKVPRGDIPTRWHLGAWLYRELERSVDDPAVRRMPGFWTWVAMAMLPILRPDGKKVGEDARYVLQSDDFRKRYRHLLAGPYFVFAAHQAAPHTLRAILSTPPHSPGDVYEQFASRQELVTSPAVMELLTTMYWNSDAGSLKSGASSNARRLADVLMQYQVNYDFGTISSAGLLEMLPREFRRFKS